MNDMPTPLCFGDYNKGHSAADNGCYGCRALRECVHASETAKSDVRNTQIGGDHYVNAGVQPWDIVDTWPVEQQIGFHRGNAMKYLMRVGAKDDPLQELKKAGHYIEKLIEVMEHQ